MNTDNQKVSETTAHRRSGRHAARIAAVQAAYQVSSTGVPASKVLAEFVEHRLSSPEGQPVYAGADRAFFGELVRGVAAEKASLDEAIAAALASGWTIERVDRVLTAILRCGAFELLRRADIPPRAAITEYVEIARAFFEGEEPGFVNAVLDAIARKVRASEMGNKPRAKAAGAE